MAGDFEGILARTKALREDWFGPRGQAKMARLLGLTPSGYNYFEVKAPLSSPLILRLAEKRKVNPDWLLLGRGPKYLDREGSEAIREEHTEYGVALRSYILPILSDEVANGPVRATKDYPAEEFITIYEQWVRHPENTFVLKVKDDAMEPEIPKGSFVGVDTLEREPVEGENFVIRVKVEYCHIRRLFLLQKGAMHFVPKHPSPTNRPFYFKKSTVNPIIGKVSWIFRVY